MTETYSLREWVETELTARNPLKVYTLICDCKNCTPQKWVRIYAHQLPALATKAGYSDQMTADQLQELAHRTIQRVGKK